MIAYLGTGLLGANFVKALLRNGKQVNVWNRTEAKAKALEADGAAFFEDPADAVEGADRIHLTLSDDAAVDEVLDRARSGFKHGVIIIDHTTTTAQGAMKRAALWEDRGFSYIHAPVFMGPPNALDCSGYMMVSGDQEVIKKIEPELAAMTGKLLNYGTEPGKAAGIKLLGNSFLMFLTSGFSDMLALAQAMDVSNAEVTSLFEAWNPGALAPARLKKIIKAKFDEPSWELNMARKDARLMMEEAANNGVSLAVLPAIASEMDRWIKMGVGKSEWTVIAKDNVG